MRTVGKIHTLGNETNGDTILPMEVLEERMLATCEKRPLSATAIIAILLFRRSSQRLRSLRELRCMNPSCAQKWESANAVETAGWLSNNLVRTRDHGTFPTRESFPSIRRYFGR